MLTSALSHFGGEATPHSHTCWLQELQVLQNRFDKVDGEATELKLQVVELQLEKADCEQRLEGETSRLQVKEY